MRPPSPRVLGYLRPTGMPGRRDEAVREFERLVRDSPDDRQARAYLFAGDRELARPADIDRVLAAALERNPKDSSILLQRAEISIERKQYGSAGADLTTALRLNPAAPEVHYLTAKLHRARGERDMYRQEPCGRRSTKRIGGKVK
jgi:tetratricopeptide (TPR) repeat protein